MKKITIDDLPNELLILIFKRLYLLHREKDPRSVIGAPNAPDAVEDWLGNPFDPFVFPFAQAKVCWRWYALLKLDPRFWTRIPIAVDSASFRLSVVAQHFCLSKDLPVEVVIARSPLGASERDPEEKARVAALLPTISQHLCRIKDIQFSLLHSDSIPDLGHWLVGQANVLESILLAHQEDQTTSSVVPLHEDYVNHQLGSQPHLLFVAPALTSLSIDSQTFSRASQSNGEWLAYAPNLRFLTITPSGNAQPVSIGTMIQVLAHARRLSSLSIRGIRFLDDYNDLPPDLPVLTPSSLTFEDLSGTDNAVASIVSTTARSFDFLTITKCSVVGLDSFFAGTLILEDLDEDCDLTAPFEDLSSYEILLENCPAFNDAVIDLMADGAQSGEDFPVKEVPRLLLRDCTNFHVENLYRMVVARRSAREASPDWDGTEDGLESFDGAALSAIVNLDVIRGPYLSQEYREKFQQVVPTFRWTNEEDEAGNPL